MIRILLAFILTTSLSCAFSQNEKDEMAFVQFMISNESYDDLIYYFGQNLNPEMAGTARYDSLFYFAGWVNYYKKKLSDSKAYFNLVGEQSTFYSASRFYLALDHMYLKEYPEADSVLMNLMNNPNHSEYADLALFELCANTLLKREAESFDSLYSILNKSNFMYEAELQYLTTISEGIKNYKKKSALAAGLLSAVIPGAGKWYVGKKGQGLAAFFMNLSFAGVATESLIRGGYDHPVFISSAVVFSIFYAGNIIGSIYNAKNYESESNETMDSNILVNMHLPIRRAFK